MTDLVHIGRQLNDLQTEETRLRQRLGQQVAEIESWKRYYENTAAELLVTEHHPDAAEEYDEARKAAAECRTALVPLCRQAADHLRAFLSVVERIRPLQATLKGAVERQREAVTILERTIGRSSAPQRPLEVGGFALPLERDGRSIFHSVLDSLEATADAYGT